MYLEEKPSGSHMEDHFNLYVKFDLSYLLYSHPDTDSAPDSPVERPPSCPAPSHTVPRMGQGAITGDGQPPDGRQPPPPPGPASGAPGPPGRGGHADLPPGAGTAGKHAEQVRAGPQQYLCFSMIYRRIKRRA